jgi:Zn-dependent protease
VGTSLALFCATLAPLIGAWPAVGLGVLVLAHETAHWLAFRLFRIWATAPIFIPFVGGLVVTRTRSRARRAYAWCILAGPVAGVVATHVVLAQAEASHSSTLASIARLGGLVNLANLLPIPGLDGWLVWRASRPAGGRARVWPRIAWAIVVYEAWVAWAAASGH